VAARRYVVPNLADFSVWSDPEGHAHDSQKGLPQEGLHSAGPESLDDTEFRISQQRKIQFVLCLEFGLSLDGVAAGAHDRGVELLELLDGVTKLGRFVRSTGSIRLRVKI
jgi:hypothetical protein